MSRDYAKNVFINCPFDKEYSEMLEAMLFAIYGCGFLPQCALKEDDSGELRLQKIERLITKSKFGVHDISRTEMDVTKKLPRFNMPFELGLFMGAKKFGDAKQNKKSTLIMDKEQYHYQVFMSDIAGQDIRSHKNNPALAITHIRNWLSNASNRKKIPSGTALNRRYKEFRLKLPDMCRTVEMAPGEITLDDYCSFVSDWLEIILRNR